MNKKPAKKRATKKNSIRGKFLQLRNRIESTNCSIDNPHLRWVTELLEIDIESSPSVITRQDLEKANIYWKQYATN